MMALSAREGTCFVRIARLETKGNQSKDSTTAIAIGWKGRKSIPSRMMLRLDDVQLADYIARGSALNEPVGEHLHSLHGS